MTSARFAALLGALLALTACESVPELTFPASDASGAPDSATDDAAVQDGAADAPVDDGASDAPVACMVPAGVDGGCCAQTIAPCVGLACGYCAACALAACKANQFCCAQLNGGGMVRDVMCAPDTHNCP
jgi:hypothetical protein